MIGIDEENLLVNFRSLYKALEQVKGNLAELAAKVLHFLSDEDDGECERFSYYEDDQNKLLQKFFA